MALAASVGLVALNIVAAVGMGDQGIVMEEKSDPFLEMFSPKRFEYWAERPMWKNYT